MARAARTRTRLDPEIRRALIIDAAERLFAARDPALVTFEDVAEEAGVSRALVHNYFGDRGGLLAEVYLRGCRALDEELARAVAIPGGARAQLEQLVDAYVSAARRDPTPWRLLGSVEQASHPQVRAVRRARWVALAETWGDTPQARLVARGVIAFIESAVLAWLEHPVDGMDADEVGAAVVAMLWSGLDGLGRLGVVQIGRR